MPFRQFCRALKTRCRHIQVFRNSWCYGGPQPDRQRPRHAVERIISRRKHSAKFIGLAVNDRKVLSSGPKYFTKSWRGDGGGRVQAILRMLDLLSATAASISTLRHLLPPCAAPHSQRGAFEAGDATVWHRAEMDASTGSRCGVQRISLRQYQPADRQRVHGCSRWLVKRCCRLWRLPG